MHVRTFKTYPSLAEILKLNPAEIQLKKELHEMIPRLSKGTLDFSEVIKKLISCKDLRTLIRLAEEDDLIEHLCLHPRLSKYWDGMLKVFGSLFESERNPPLQPQKSLHSFNLLRGRYFYQHARKIHQLLGSQLGFLEEQFLVQALKYSCPQAAFELNRNTFSQLKQGDDKSSDHLAKTAIKRASALTKHHKAVGFMMLAEAWGQYGICLMEKPGNEMLVKRCYLIALSACNKVQDLLDTSKVEIANAGGEQGLGAINTFGITSPLQAKKTLNEYFVPYFSKPDRKEERVLQSSKKAG